MEQLIMRWKNDGQAAKPIQVPQGCQIVNFLQLDNALDHWLNIVQYGLSNGKKGAAYYHDMMTVRPLYKEDKCFFILENGNPVATLTVICDYENKEGYVHMVACLELFRGKGYGSLLNQIAEFTLKEEGMETAYLTTDDWRIPAIKSYLRIGFTPDLSTEDFQRRWESLYAQLGR